MRASSRRKFASLSNPMFPGIRQPEVPYDFSTPNTDDKGKKKNDDDDQSLLGKYGGKIALVAFSLAGVLLWAYFKGGKNKSDVEDNILDKEPLEPYEVHELRYSNRGMDKVKLEQVMDHCIEYCRAHPEGFDHPAAQRSGDYIIPYITFISLCNKVLKQDDPQAKINSGYLLDRLVLHRAVCPAGINGIVVNDTTSSSTIDSSAKADLSEAMVSLPLALVAISMICTGPVDDRLAVLFNIGRRFGAQHASRGCNDSNIDTDSGSEGKNFEGNISYTDFAALLNQLLLTCQIPSEKRVIASEETIAYKIKQSEATSDFVSIIAWPFEAVRDYFKPKEYTQKSARELADGALAYEADKKRLDMGKDNKIQLTKDADIVAKPERTNQSEISFANFKVLVLGYAVCAWGECYGHSGNHHD